MGPWVLQSIFKSRFAWDLTCLEAGPVGRRSGAASAVGLGAWWGGGLRSTKPQASPYAGRPALCSGSWAHCWSPRPMPFSADAALCTSKARSLPNQHHFCSVPMPFCLAQNLIKAGSFWVCGGLPCLRQSPSHRWKSWHILDKAIPWIGLEKLPGKVEPEVSLPPWGLLWVVTDRKCWLHCQGKPWGF